MQKTLFIKLSIIAGLCLLFAVGLTMLHSLVSERQRYAEDVVAQIASQHVQPQKLITPFMIVPTITTPACRLPDASPSALPHSVADHSVITTNTTNNNAPNNASTNNTNSQKNDKNCPEISHGIQPIFADHTQSSQNFAVSDDTYQRGIYHATSFEGTISFEQSFGLADFYESIKSTSALSKSESSSPSQSEPPSPSQSQSQPQHLQITPKGDHKQMVWAEAKLIIPISDLRGVASLPTVQIGNTTLKSRYPDTPIIQGLSYVEVDVPAHVTQQLRTSLLDATLRDKYKTSSPSSSHSPFSIDLNVALPLSGISHVLTAPTGQNFEMSMQGDWHAPNFIGDALPNHKELQANAFVATWQNHYLTVANNQLISQCFTNKECDLNSRTTLNEANANHHDYYDMVLVADMGQQNNSLTSFGTSFAQPNDVYLQTERTMKYALLLILVSFGTFFLFEVIKSSRIHPIQYLLVGAALLVFYVLLLPLAEQIKFWQAYAISAVACVGLIGFYSYYVLGSMKRASVFTALLGGLYAGFYGILTTEEFNLLLGAVFCFALLASVMVLTRKINWYDVT